MAVVLPLESSDRDETFRGRSPAREPFKRVLPSSLAFDDALIVSDAKSQDPLGVHRALDAFHET